MRVPWTQAGWEKVLVYGLGVSGTAAVRLLRFRGLSVVAVDRRQDLDLGSLAGDREIEWRLGKEPCELVPGLDGVVVSPGVDPHRPLLVAARRAGIPVIAEVELAFPLLNGPLVAITGTNGKSTTTSMAGALLAAAGHGVEVCGNIGAPLSSRVEGPRGRVFVVELSSFQLEATVCFRARAAALLNLTPDHLDRYPDMETYARTKGEIFARQGTGDVAVLNADDPRALATGRAVLGRTGAHERLFSRHEPVTDGCYLEADVVLEVEPGADPVEVFGLRDLPVSGVHNVENAMAAVLLARALGAPPSALRQGLAGFQGLPHRLQEVRRRGGVVWYDDSKGTNLDATHKSLEGFPDASVHLILGGRGKGTDPSPLRRRVAQKARRLYLIGESAPELERALGGTVPMENVGTVEKAVERAAANARPGEVVLLSPACASFDQFRNFMERGERFQSLVRALPEEAGP